MESNVPELTKIADLLNDLSLIIQRGSLDKKAIWTIEELCEYTSFAQGYIYKLTCAGEIPFLKPNGKKLFFERDKIFAWLKEDKTLLEIKEANLFSLKTDRR